MLGLAAMVTLASAAALLGLGIDRERGPEPIPTTPEPAKDPIEAQAEEAFFAGQVAFEAGSYAEALADFLEAKRLHPVAELDFNIGECHDRLGQSALAITAFESYLRGVEQRTGHQAADHADIERRIAELRD
jgi:tetratricopeptide (TPR) repeat protein